MGAFSAAELAASPRVLLFAHRGSSREAPENTLASFRVALKVRVDGVELDYAHTSDGVPVVFHDKDLGRTTNYLARFGGEKAPLLAETTLERLRQLDLGGWFHPTFANEPVATLAEALDVIQPHGLTLIERKAGDAATIVALLRDKECIEHVIVQAFDWQFLADCRRLAPELTLAALGEHEVTVEKLAAARDAGAAMIGWNQQHLTAQAIALAHSHGMQAWTWTVNDAQRCRQLVAWGINAITSDVPALMRGVLDELDS